MAEINIEKTVYNRKEFERVVDRGFKTFVPPVEIADLDTVTELFRLYNKLYLETISIITLPDKFVVFFGIFPSNFSLWIFINSITLFCVELFGNSQIALKVFSLFLS